MGPRKQIDKEKHKEKTRSKNQKKKPRIKATNKSFLPRNKAFKILPLLVCIMEGINVVTFRFLIFMSLYLEANNTNA